MEGPALLKWEKALRAMCAKMGAKFVSYKAEGGVWRFEVRVCVCVWVVCVGVCVGGGYSSACVEDTALRPPMQAIGEVAASHCMLNWTGCMRLLLCLFEPSACLVDWLID
jgi:hypothetical protein